MTIYRLPDWLGGHRAHLIHGPEREQVTIEVWVDDRPSGHYLTLLEHLLTRLPDPDAPTPAQVLETPVGPNDAGAGTVREYLVALAEAVWDQGEGFSGKRPWGNSGWEHDLYHALGARGHIRYEQDEHGYCESVDREAGHRLIRQALEAMRESE